MILAANAPEQLGTAIALAKNSEASAIESEREVFGLAHDGIGGYLLALWGIPQSIVEAVAFHHQPEQFSGTALDSAVVTYFANMLVNEASGVMSNDERDQLAAVAEATGVSEQLDVWRDKMNVDEE